jgi:hypothetical protein
MFWVAAICAYKIMTMQKIQFMTGQEHHDSCSGSDYEWIL